LNIAVGSPRMTTCAGAEFALNASRRASWHCRYVGSGEASLLLAQDVSLHSSLHHSLPTMPDDEVIDASPSRPTPTFASAWATVERDCDGLRGTAPGIKVIRRSGVREHPDSDLPSDQGETPDPSEIDVCKEHCSHPLPRCLLKAWPTASRVVRPWPSVHESQVPS
jgi:hypothetical protein